MSTFVVKPQVTWWPVIVTRCPRACSVGIVAHGNKLVNTQRLAGQPLGTRGTARPPLSIMDSRQRCRKKETVHDQATNVSRGPGGGSRRCTARRDRPRCDGGGRRRGAGRGVAGAGPPVRGRTGPGGRGRD